MSVTYAFIALVTSTTPRMRIRKNGSSSAVSAIA
jgi:hypothetical protein